MNERVPIPAAVFAACAAPTQPQQVRRRL